MLDYIHRSSMSQESFQEKVRVELDLLSPIIVGAKEKTPGTELDINKEKKINSRSIQINQQMARDE